MCPQLGDAAKSFNALKSPHSVRDQAERVTELFSVRCSALTSASFSQRNSAHHRTRNKPRTRLLSRSGSR